MKVLFHLPLNVRHSVFQKGLRGRIYSGEMLFEFAIIRNPIGISHILNHAINFVLETFFVIRSILP